MTLFTRSDTYSISVKLQFGDMIFDMDEVESNYLESITSQLRYIKQNYSESLPNEGEIKIECKNYKGTVVHTRNSSIYWNSSKKNIKSLFE